MDISRLYFFLAPYAGSLSINPAIDRFEDDSSPGTFYSGTVELNINAADLRMAPVSMNIVEGNAIDMNSILPKNKKQKDFIKDVIKQHHLFIQPQKDNPKVLDIEPRDSFYHDTYTDWSNKLDKGSDLMIEPLGALKFRDFEFDYKTDKDYYNKLYSDTWSENYGYRRVILENEYLKGSKKIQVGFSPTPLIGDDAHDRVYSQIFKSDNDGNKVQLEHNLRILYYGGLKNTNQAWTHKSDLVPDVVRTNYAYAGHLDDPYNPTVDLNWGLSKEIYYDGTYQTVNGTINGLVNAHYYNYIKEISSINSKLVTAKFNLNAQDINDLDFRNRYYFNNAFYRLQEVKDYNPINCELTSCLFILLDSVVSFVDVPFVINGGSGEVVGGIADEELPAGRMGYIDNNVR